MKPKIKGTVAIEIIAEATNTSPSNPRETPNENKLAAKTGAIVCAKPAIAQAIPKVPPCASFDVLKEINVLNVTYCIPKPKETTEATAKRKTKF